MKAAVLPSKGIGDALLMMIASHQLLLQGYEVTTFHGALRQLAAWFPGHRFAESRELSSFDLVIIENDNSFSFPGAVVFYPTYKEGKHPPLSPADQVFSPDLPMAENIAIAMERLLNKGISKDNGIRPPSGLVHRLYRQRIVIHPGSSEEKKNWPLDKFRRVAQGLKRRGYYPVFAIAAQEKERWPSLEERVLLNDLSELASLIYESGAVIGNDSLLCHLASNLNIPNLVIGDDAERLQLWRPGWLKGAVVTPAHWRRKRWKTAISSRKVLSLCKDVFRTHECDIDV